ncbi:MAG: T9SS type A sorting domain-containing protein, partial [Saprospiraceae bacterium]
LSPNPTGGIARLTLEFDRPADLRVQVMNMLGQAVWETNFSRTTQVSGNIDLQAYPDGLYLLQVTREGQTKTMKLIKSARR